MELNLPAISRESGFEALPQALSAGPLGKGVMVAE